MLTLKIKTISWTFPVVQRYRVLDGFGNFNSWFSLLFFVQASYNKNKINTSNFSLFIGSSLLFINSMLILGPMRFMCSSYFQSTTVVYIVSLCSMVLQFHSIRNFQRNRSQLLLIPISNKNTQHSVQINQNVQFRFLLHENVHLYVAWTKTTNYFAYFKLFCSNNWKSVTKYLIPYWNLNEIVQLFQICTKSFISVFRWTKVYKNCRFSLTSLVKKFPFVWQVFELAAGSLMFLICQCLNRR